MVRQDTKTLKESWEAVLYSTKFQPSYYLHLTYREDCRPPQGSQDHLNNVEGLLRSIARQTKEHVLCYGGAGSDNHSHLIICAMGGRNGYKASKEDAGRIVGLWKHGLSMCDVYDRNMVGGAMYALNKHDILDGVFNKVFCPRIKKSCKQHPKGCVFAWKKGHLRKQSQQ